MSTTLRPSGIPAVGDLPWGSHFCQFYGERDDLVDSLVPYFKAGLENNEHCLWVTSEPFRASDARTMLRAACRLHVKADAPVVGHWDRMRLEQVVTNLLSNAIKYAPGTDIELSVEGRDDTAALVDDDVGINDALSEVLMEEGYAVVVTTNGAEALRYLRGNAAPSLILLDLMMPVMDGYEFREHQRQDPALGRIPVLVLSAGHLGERVTRMGVAGVFKKPIALESLLATIEEHCGPPA